MNEDSNNVFYVYGFAQAGLVPEAAGAAMIEAGDSASVLSGGIEEPHPPYYPAQRESGSDLEPGFADLNSAEQRVKKICRTWLGWPRAPAGTRPCWSR